MEEEKEEEMTTLDMKEIQNMAQKLEADEVGFNIFWKCVYKEGTFS